MEVTLYTHERPGAGLTGTFVRWVKRAVALLIMLLAVTPAVPALAASLDVQERCATRARTLLLELRQDEKAKYSRRNHYSEQLQRCFVWVGMYSNGKKTVDWRESLLDGYEGTSYGEFMLFANDLQKHNKSATAPIMCYVDLPQGTEQCTSFIEFTKLVGVYLEMP